MNPVPLHHQSFGAGPALAILHGLFGSGTNWRSIGRRLGDCRRVHLLDARNHGASPHTPRMDYANMAADVEAFLDAQGVEQADLVGHSMGGKTAMLVALRAPARVRRLVVVDIAPEASDSDHRPLLEALLAMPVATYARRGEADAALRAAVPDPGLRAFLLQSLASDGGGGLRWRLNLRALHDSMAALLAFAPPSAAASFDGPTLFVRGARSDYLADRHTPAIRRLFPEARVATIEDAGHWLHADQPQRLVELLREFLGCDAG